MILLHITRGRNAGVTRDGYFSSRMTSQRTQALSIRLLCLFHPSLKAGFPHGQKKWLPVCKIFSSRRVMASPLMSVLTSLPGKPFPQAHHQISLLIGQNCNHMSFLNQSLARRMIHLDQSGFTFLVHGLRTVS